MAAPEQVNAIIMPWSQTVFERETIYAEVWKEPVNTVAKRYGISDVALRKICEKLGVPVPPLGYWARLAAGQTPLVAKLSANHKGPTRHVRQQWDDPEASERDSRIAAVLEDDPPPSLAPPALKGSVAECHPAVRRTAKQLKHQKYNGRGLLHTQGQDVFPMSVSAGNKDRALLVLDALLETALRADAKLEISDKTSNRLMLRLRGELFRLCIREASERAERDLTREELNQKKQGKLFYIPDRYTFTPTGKLRLEVREDDRYSPLLSVTDGTTAIETRLESVIPTLMQKAVELRVRREMRDEEHLRWQAAQERREALEVRRDEELERLEQTEKWIADWKRAADLRAFAAALESGAQSEDNPAAEVAWIRNAADWLDPLVDKRWPDVDIDESDDALLDDEEDEIGNIGKDRT